MRFNDLPSAIKKKDEIENQLSGREPAVFLDYDGTLTPIVNRPEDAKLSSKMRSVLEELATVCSLAIVSGRDRKDVEQLVGIDSLYYAGSHGFDISGPGGMHQENEGGRKCLPALDKAEEQLRKRLDSIAGAQVERKRFSIAVHFRNAQEKDIPGIKKIAEDVLDSFSELRESGGKMIIELQPDIDWDKGKAVNWLMERLDLDKPEVLPIYIGDDITDEDAFSALTDRGIGILVGDHGQNTKARYSLKDVDQTRRFLKRLIEIRREEG